MSTDGSLLQKVDVKRETVFGASGKTLAKQLVRAVEQGKAAVINCHTLVSGAKIAAESSRQSFLPPTHAAVECS